MPDRRFDGELECPRVSTFLSQPDIERILPVWNSVFESDDVPSAVDSLRSPSDSDGYRSTLDSELIASEMIDEDAELDRRLAEICGE